MKAVPMLAEIVAYEDLKVGAEVTVVAETAMPARLLACLHGPSVGCMLQQHRPKAGLGRLSDREHATGGAAAAGVRAVPEHDQRGGAHGRPARDGQAAAVHRGRRGPQDDGHLRQGAAQPTPVHLVLVQ